MNLSRLFSLGAVVASLAIPGIANAYPRSPAPPVPVAVPVRPYARPVVDHRADARRAEELRRAEIQRAEIQRAETQRRIEAQRRVEEMRRVEARRAEEARHAEALRQQARIAAAHDHGRGGPFDNRRR